MHTKKQLIFFSLLFFESYKWYTSVFHVIYGLHKYTAEQRSLHPYSSLQIQRLLSDEQEVPSLLPGKSCIFSLSCFFLLSQKTQGPENFLLHNGRFWKGFDLFILVKQLKITHMRVKSMIFEYPVGMLAAKYCCPCHGCSGWLTYYPLEHQDVFVCSKELGEIANSKGGVDVHPKVHRSTVYHSQDMEAT